MATMMQERPETFEESSTASERDYAGEPPRRRLHWKRWVGLGGLAVVALLVALLPQFMSTAMMRQRLANSLLQDFDGVVEIGGADFSWWRPSELSQMTMTDRQGATMARIESASVTTPLWRMFWPGTQAFELKVNRPEIVYEIDKYGRTNWERVLAGLRPSRPGSFGWPEFRHGTQPLRIRVIDGNFVLRDHVSGRTIEAKDVDIQMKRSVDFLEGVLSGNTQLVSQDEALAGGKLRASFQLAMAGDQVVAGDVEGKIEKTPLEMVQPWLKQMVPHLHLSAGNADGEFQSKWTGNLRTGLKLAVEGTLSASEVSVQSTEWAAGHRLTGDTLTGTFAIDNTLPTIPGKFDIDWTLSNSQISEIPAAELPEELTKRELLPVLDKPLQLGKISLQTRGTLNALKQELGLETCALRSDVFSAEMEGMIRDLASGQLDFDLEGTSRGDLLPFVFLARPDWQLHLSGKRLTAEEFALKGRIQDAFGESAPAADDVDDRRTSELEEAPSPESLADLPRPVAPSETTDLKKKQGSSTDNSDNEAEPEPFAARARWNWEELEAYGVTSHSGSLVTLYEERVLKIIPRDVKIGPQGEFLAYSEIDFNRKRKVLRVGEGMVLRNVDFTEKMCRSWLEYVAPVLAEATDVEGRYSLYVKEADIDLTLGQATALSGVLQIQKTRLGPGPLVQQLTAPLQGVVNIPNQNAPNRREPGALLKEGATWIELPPQEVVFIKKEDRLYHSSLEYQAGRIRFISTGSVGEDKSLDLVLTIPLDFIAQGRPLARLLQQRPIELRVKGTLKQPDIDASQLANMGKQLGQDALNSLLQGIRERQRDR